MANGYQYGTSPRKLEPEYVPNIKRKQVQKKKVQPKNKKKSKKKFKLSFEAKFFINSMLFFSLIFAIIACQALVEQRYKEKESLKKEYNELISSNNLGTDDGEDIRILASEYGMQTKSATLINLDTSDYIESSGDEIEIQECGFFQKIINWFKEMF